MKHLVTLADWSTQDIREVLELAMKVKANPATYGSACLRRTMLMIFEKPSLRTRISFETGMTQLGGHGIYYNTANSPMGSGKESLHDTIVTASRFVDIVMARLFEHENIEKMAEFSTVPVINALTNYAHPCQILGDLQTIMEKKGDLSKLKLAYVGDSNNNVTHSLLFGCTKVGMSISVGCPEGEEYEPRAEVLEKANAFAEETGCVVEVHNDAAEAVKGADVVYTDSWMSYHIDKDKQERRVADLMPFQVNSELTGRANDGAIFMNCLPALRGYEQTAEVIDGPQSVVFDEAENRLHAQKAVVLRLLGKA
ncbi:MAG: ornithine carbamoyltransferase [Planctomycetota bacterium]|nr:ornithine carbamoyltransferase [Planctomycetota bacterium]